MEREKTGEERDELVSEKLEPMGGCEREATGVGGGLQQSHTAPKR